MPHHIYTTPGFVIHSSPHGEAGKFFLVFTRDLGMIGASAQGVRLSQSKLRYYVQDFSYSLLSFVRGKEMWRMTGAKEIEEIGEMKKDNRRLFVRILTLLKRLLHGEEKNEKLFLIIENFSRYLGGREMDKEGRELVEYVTVLRILDCLGYISNKNAFSSILSGSVLNEGILNEVKLLKASIIVAINNGLKESQL